MGHMVVEVAVVLVDLVLVMLVMVYLLIKLPKMQLGMQMVVEVLEKLDTQVVLQQQVFLY